MLTVDGPLSGNREWDQPNYAAPDRPSFRALLNAVRHGRWCLRMIAGRRLPNFDNLVEFAGVPSIFQVPKWIGRNQNPGLCWVNHETETVLRKANLGERIS